ncbi:carboxymuconolactone decarboxylase family protein [Micrococcus luteus]|nr:carboxymuconolactone decarboxylase family protein [Micrococcus luteus]
MTTHDLTASNPEQTERERFDRGMARMMELVGDGAGTFDHAKLVESYRDVDPELSDYIVSFAFGDIYSRTSLSKQQQTLVTISTLVGRGAEPQLKLHINVGFTVGLTREEIVGALIHCIPYVGFPHVLNALSLLKEVEAERAA